MKILQINNVELTEKSLQAIYEGIKFNKSIKKLDLAYCAIPDSLHNVVCKIIEVQGQ